MSLDTIRTAIVAKLDTVADIGVTHRYERYTVNEKDFKALFVTSGKLLGWYVRRRTTSEREASHLHNTIIHTWVIRGYMSLDDATESEVVFDALVESARDAFRDDITIGGVVNTTVIDGKAGLQLDDSGPVVFSGVLCHSAKLSLMTESDIEPGATAMDAFQSLHVDYDIPPHGNVAAPLPAAETDAEDEIQPEQAP